MNIRPVVYVILIALVALGIGLGAKHVIDSYTQVLINRINSTSPTTHHYYPENVKPASVIYYL
jgi:hypothetical protein